MNKARITYRFDPNRGRGDEGEQIGRGENGRVIPLYQEEYRVEEERAEERPVEQQHREPRQQRSEPPQYRSNRKNEPDIHDYQGLNQYTTDYGAWSSPFDAETRRIEELIRESNERENRRPGGEPPVQSDRSGRMLTDYEEKLPERGHPRMPFREEEPDRERARYNGSTGYYRGPELDYEEESYDGPFITGPRYVRHTRPPWLKISAAITGAAVTGVLLGIFALSMFNGMDSAEEAESTGKPAAADTQNVQPVTGTLDTAKSTAGTSTAATGKEVALAYAGRTYSILQSGTFSAQQGADQAKNDLVKNGLAAATELSDKFYVFAGIATDKESATALGQRLKASGKLADVYVKAYTVPAVSKVRWNGNADTLKSYLEQSDKLLQSISLLTVMNLDTDKPGAIEASTMQSVGTAHTAWSQVSNTVAQEAGENHKALVQRMNNAMNSAKTSLDEYKKNPSSAMLWQAQTYAMQFIIAEKELLSKIQ